MPRPKKIWKRSQDGFYYFTDQGEKVKLLQDYRESQALFHELMAAKKKQKPKPKGKKLLATVHDLAEQYLEFCSKNREQRTYENNRHYLSSFCNHVGKLMRVVDLDGTVLDKWSDATGWGPSTRAAGRSVVIACLNWGESRKLILDNPLAGVERGSYERRERILSPEEREKIHSVLRGPFADFWRVIELTGARPFSEIGSLTAEMIDWKEGSVTFKRHKTRYKGKRRVVYFVPEALAILKRLAAEHPEGPLFLTQKGVPWRRQPVTKRMRRLEARLKIPRLTIYALRHSYITDCLAKGMSADVVAELTGNSPRTIAKFYSHIDQKKDALREAARRAVSEDPGA